VFFLHLGRETKPRWKLAVFVGMIIIVAILAFGSLWIMANLNYHMAPSQTDTFIVKDEGIHE
jgi:cytochrome o ubiquinol oxidase operon protein cyoD